jgi:soluble epoxide hydrolase/lipid-phosphate phosphatase
MDTFDKKTLKSSRGYTYTYYVADGDKSLPALFFLHGWPDHAEVWKDVAGPLRSTKHPIIVPDLLGYDGTSKPTDPAEYKWDVMTNDLVEIIDAEGYDKVVSVGHDWGSVCAARLYNYHPDRVVGLVLLNVAYIAPTSEHFDLDSADAFTKNVFGYSLFSYWYLFTSDDGAAILKDNIERLHNVMHGTGDSMKHFFCTPNAMKDYLLNGNQEVQLRPYAQDEKFKKDFIDRFRRDGFEGPQCWYKAVMANYQSQTEKQLPEGADKVTVPVLYIGCKDDGVCRPEVMDSSIQAGLLPQLEQADMIDAAHWIMYEQPTEVIERMEDWLQRHFTK